MIIQVVDTTADNNPRISAVALCSTNRRFLGYFCAFFFRTAFPPNDRVESHRFALAPPKSSNQIDKSPSPPRRKSLKPW